MTSRKLSILFAIRNTTAFYNYRGIVRSLLLRGHSVKVSFERFQEDWTDGIYLEPVKAFQKEHPEFTYDQSQARRDRWFNILVSVRAMLTYRRFLINADQSTYYRDRYARYLLWPIRMALRVPVCDVIAKAFLKNGITGKILLFVEWIAPPHAPIREEITRMNPDVVIASAGNLPMTSADIEYLKAAASLGIPAVFPIISWDYLATKGILPPFIDELLLWNEAQVKEAKTHHHFPEARMRVTGAPYFDDWFAAHSPSMTRNDFCARHGLRPEDGIVTYLGSSKGMAKDETDLVRGLRSSLDAHADPAVRRMQIIVRPHPVNAAMYRSLDLRDTIILPAEGSLPDMDESFQLFYDTLYHSIAAVVGVNTTAVIESIITGKPVVAIVTDEYRKKQRDTIHFRQLMSADALYQAAPDGVADIVASILDGKDSRREKREAFVAHYIRPRGLERAAGEYAVDEIERIVEAWRKRNGLHLNHQSESHV